MGNCCASLRGYLTNRNNPVVQTAPDPVHTISKTCSWTWRESREALRRSGYRFIREISNDPSICLARYSNPEYAVCILRRSRGEVAEDSGEIRFWNGFNHDNILALHGKFDDADSVYFATDPVVRGHVSGLLERSDVDAGKAREEFFQNVTRQALSALAEMHRIGLAHLDFTWSQVWLNAENNAFLGGFGKTTSFHHPGDASVSVGRLLTCGNKSSLAPEIFRTDPDLALLPKADVWAVGVALFEALTAKSNYIDPAAVFEALIDEGGIQRVRSHLWGQRVSAAAIAFITDLLELEPSKRPSAAECLQQPWLIEKKTSDALMNLLLSPEEAIAAEAVEEAVANLHRPLGEILQQNGCDIQKVLFKDVPNGMVVATAKCLSISKCVSVMAEQETWKTWERFYWEDLCHERLMKFVYGFADSGVVFSVTDLMTQGNVEHCAKKERVYDRPPLRREEFYRPIVTHMVEGLHDLHRQGLVHLDLHWRNVFLYEDAGAQLGGFRHLYSLQDEERPTLGYMPFRAPESFIPGALRKTTLQKADIWSLGAALLHSVAQLNIGGHQFEEGQIRPSRKQCIFANIYDNLPRLAEALSRGDHSQEFQDLVISLMRFRPELRPTADEILHHPWLLQSSDPKLGTDVV